MHLVLTGLLPYSQEKERNKQRGVKRQSTLLMSGIYVCKDTNYLCIGAYQVSEMEMSTVTFLLWAKITIQLIFQLKKKTNPFKDKARKNKR